MSKEETKSFIVAISRFYKIQAEDEDDAIEKFKNATSLQQENWYKATGYLNTVKAVYTSSPSNKNE